METIKIRASLKLALRSDIFSGVNTYANKVLFVNCPENGTFKGLYTIPELDNKSYVYGVTASELQEIKDRNTSIKHEIYSGLATQLFYKLSDSHNEFDFQFQLILRPGDWFDFFQAEQWLKPNVVYYVRVNNHEVSGPHYMPTMADIVHIKKAIENKQLYVPSANQTFEPYKIAAAS